MLDKYDSLSQIGRVSENHQWIKTAKPLVFEVDSIPNLYQGPKCFSAYGIPDKLLRVRSK